jgi:xanthine dehydrogenase accessory factor
LVASPRRGRAVLAELALDDAQRARIRTPAGLDIGARTAGEIALSILTEIVTDLRAGRLEREGSARPSAPTQVIDPVCGMTVTVMPDTPHLVVDGVDFWFCNPGCRDRYAELSAG